MNDYPVLSKLLEYYQHYSFWLILAVLLNTFLLVHINRQLQEVGPLSKNRAGYGALELQSVCLILFTLAAAFLLSINLGLDEFDSMEGVNSMLAKGIISEHSLAFLSFSIMFAHQPIYALMLNLIIRLSGLEYFGLLLRSISVFWATLTVYLTYKFSFKILKNKYIAYFSATFLCLHSLFYFYARRVEGYSLFCFLALLSYYYFWNEFIIEENNSLWKYVTASIACLMVHYLTLFIILSQLITMVLLKWNKNILASRSMIRFVKALLIFCFTVILVAPVIYLSTVNNEFLFKNNWFRNNWQNNFYLGRNYLPDIISNLTRLILGSPKGEFFIYLYILIFIIIIYKIRK